MVSHAIPGRTVVARAADPMKWYFKSGTDPDHETYLYRRLGVQDMGSIFYKLRLDVDKRERYARDSEKPQEGMKTTTKIRETEHVFFTGEQEITVKQADTKNR